MHSLTRGEVGSNAGRSDQALIPTHSGTHQEPVLRGYVLQRLAEFSFQPLSGEDHRFLQKVIERSSLQGRDTKFRKNFLLTKAQTQRAIARLFSAGFVRRGLDNGFPWSV